MATYQRRKFTCGPTSLHNAVAFLYGIGPSEDDFTEACRCGSEGTTEHQLKRGLRKFGFMHKSMSHKTVDGALLAVQEEVENGNAVVIYGYHRVHWFVVIGYQADHYIVIDSADPELVVRYSQERLLNEWNPDAKHRFYAISVNGKH